MMKKQLSFIALFGMVGALTLMSACSPVNRVEPQLVATPDPIGLRLASAVDRASAALQTLASVEQARHPNVAIATVPYAPVELRRTVSLDWVGPIEPVTRRMADRAGYQMQVNGDVPPAPVIVTLNAKQKSVVEILRDVGLQAGTRATIVVDTEKKLVELNYAPVSGG